MPQLTDKLTSILTDKLTSINKRARNGSTAHNVNGQKIDGLSKEMQYMRKDMDDFRGLLTDFMFYVSIKGSDGRRIFPITDKNAMDAFLLDDGKKEERILVLERYLYTLVAPDISYAQLSQALLYGLFDRSYIKTHKWPNPR